jgi:predicted alpha/beta hydrolase
VAANATDDLWALPASRDAFMAAYRNTDWRAVTVRPADLGLRRIGHMGYFRPQAEALWTRALDWFDSLTPQRLDAPCLA